MCPCCIRVGHSASMTMIWVSQPCNNKGTPIEAMRYLLDLISMETRHKVEQVNAYFNSIQNHKNLLNDTVKEEKGYRQASHGLAKQNSQSIMRAALQGSEDSQKRPVKFKPYYKTLLPENLGTHYCESSAEKKLCKSTNACRSQQQATWHRDLLGRLSYKGPVWMGVHGQARRKDCTREQWRKESRPSVWPWR